MDVLFHLRLVWLTRPLVLAIAALCIVLVLGGTVMKARVQKTGLPAATEADRAR